MRTDLIMTPYGRKTPELLCRAMDALILLEEISDARARQLHEFDVDAWFVKVRKTIGEENQS